jgi:hypothetical protein
MAFTTYVHTQDELAQGVIVSVKLHDIDNKRRSYPLFIVQVCNGEVIFEPAHTPES